jgi:hypothetical protein
MSQCRVTTNAFASPRNRLSFQTRCTCKSTFCACISNALRWRSPVHKSQLDLYNLALVITLRYFSTSFAICLDAESSSLAFTGSTAVWEIWEAKETTVTLINGFMGTGTPCTVPRAVLTPCLGCPCLAAVLLTHILCPIRFATTHCLQ